MADSGEFEISTGSENEVPTEPPTVDPGAQQFAILVRNLLEEYANRYEAAFLRIEKRSTKTDECITRLSGMLDILIRDARGLHLLVADHENKLAHLATSHDAMEERMYVLEQRVGALQDLVKKLAPGSTSLQSE